MASPVLGLEVSELGGILETGVDEMLQVKLPRELIKTDTPVDLGLLANGETVGIGEQI